MRRLYGGRVARKADRRGDLRAVRADGAQRASGTPVEGFDLPATVRESRYAGGNVLTYLTMADGSEAVATSDGKLADALKPGSTAYLYWNPAQAAVIGGSSYGA